MSRILFISLVSLHSLYIIAQRVDLVVLRQNVELVIENNYTATETANIELLINANNRNYCRVYIPYDDFSKVEQFQAELADPGGKILKKFKKSDWQDISNISGISLIEDDRSKMLDACPEKIPLILKYSYTKKYSNIMFLPEWRPLILEGVAVNQSAYSIRYPEGIPFTILSSKAEGLRIKADTSNGVIVHAWETRNLAPPVMEKHSLPHHLAYPYVKPLAGNFKYGGKTVSNSTWQDIGQWYYELQQGRGVLISEDSAFVRGLAGLPHIEIVEQVYRYMQKRCRYVSIQLGIGGWQSAPASEVGRVKYGDCKALTNYMSAMLGAAGIASFPVLVMAGEDFRDFIIPEQPVRTFNHVILCVPLGQDTLWLENTSMAIPFGFLGTFTAGRWGLLVRDQGSALVKIPDDDAATMYNHHKQISLRTDGSALIEGRLEILGGETGDWYHFFLNGTEQHRLGMLRNAIATSGLSSITYSVDSSRLGKGNFNVSYKAIHHNHASRSGVRLFVQPLWQDAGAGFLNLSGRTAPVYRSGSISWTDRNVYLFPDGFGLESLPGSSEVLVTPGKASYQYDVSVGGITAYRELILHEGIFHQESFGEIEEISRIVTRQNSAKIVLLKE